MAFLTDRDEIKNTIRDAADIVQIISECVDLKKTGASYIGLCPFHAEKTPSFSVNPKGQFFHCFGCGESGDVFSFVMKYHRLDFPQALKELAKRFQIELPEPQLSEIERRRVKERELLYSIYKKATSIYERYLHESSFAGKARKYLEERGIPVEFVREFRLGYAPDPKSSSWTFLTSALTAGSFPLAAVEGSGLVVKKDKGHYDRFRDRIIFPIIDMTGRVAAFGGRILSDEKPKYMNSPESPIFDKSRMLFGLYQNKESIRSSRRAIVVEGYFDLLLLSVHGITNTVAPLGTALSRSHIRLLRGFCDEVVLLFDGDSAGLNAATRTVPFFLAEQVDAKVALLPEGHDPDSLVRTKGAAAIEELISSALPLAEFVFKAMVKEHGLSLEGKNKIIGELRQLLQSGEDSVQRSLIVAHFSEKLGMEPQQFQAIVQQQIKRPQVDRVGKEQSLEDLPKIKRQLIDFLIIYPEFFQELLEAGFETVMHEPAAQPILLCLKELSNINRLTPGDLLSALPGETEKKYVARLLTRESSDIVNEDNQGGRSMCDELVKWLSTALGRQNCAELQQRIDQAESAGNTELVMTLLRQKQELGKKIINFPDNLLKEI